MVRSRVQRDASYKTVRNLFTHKLRNATDAQATTLIRFIGALLLFIGFSLFVVRWNTVNGPNAGGPGAFVVSATSLYIAFSGGGGLSGWHVFAVMFLLAGLHLCFNANPMWTPETLAQKIKDRAARKAAKNK